MPQANMLAAMGQRQPSLYDLAMAAPDAFWNSMGRGQYGGYSGRPATNVAYNGNATGQYFQPSGASAAWAASTNNALADRDSSLGVEYLRQQGQNQRLGAMSPLLAALLGGGAGGGITGFTSSFGQGVDSGYKPGGGMMGMMQQGAPQGMNPQKFENDAWKADMRAKAKAENYY